MTIKAIVLDIDGTLVTDTKKISPKTKLALLDAQKKGITLILASGRPTSGMLSYAKELELDKNNGFIVSYNGALVVDFSQKKEIFSQPLSISLSQKILKHLEQFHVIPMIAKENYLYVNNVYNGMLQLDFEKEPFNIIEYEARSNNFYLCEKENLASFIDFPLHKILVAAAPDYLQKNWELLLAPFKHDLTGVFSAPMYFEFTNKGIDKANAVEQALLQMNISSKELLSFGDGHNDLSLIHYAGTSVAMGNAVPELKQAASHVTATNNDDGIAIALNELL